MRQTEVFDNCISLVHSLIWAPILRVWEVMWFALGQAAEKWVFSEHFMLGSRPLSTSHGASGGQGTEQEWPIPVLGNWQKSVTENRAWWTQSMSMGPVGGKSRQRNAQTRWKQREEPRMWWGRRKSRDSKVLLKRSGSFAWAAEKWRGANVNGGGLGLENTVLITSNGAVIFSAISGRHSGTKAD